MMARSYQTISILQERKIYLGPIYLDLKSILLANIELHISALSVIITDTLTIIYWLMWSCGHNQSLLDFKKKL